MESEDEIGGVVQGNGANHTELPDIIKRHNKRNGGNVR